MNNLIEASNRIWGVVQLFKSRSDFWGAQFTMHVEETNNLLDIASEEMRCVQSGLLSVREEEVSNKFTFTCRLLE
jgi:hypothetical protein